jgi:hypothetical protein
VSDRFIPSWEQLRCPHGLSLSAYSSLRDDIRGNLPALTQSKAYQVCIPVGNFLGDYMLLSMASLCASPHSVFCHHHLPSTCRLLTAGCPSLLNHISSIFDMSQLSSSTTFQALFDAALQDYKDKTGNTLTDHPIAKQLETCESVNSITAILQDQARNFREFRKSDGRLMKALNSSVGVLCAPSISSALNEAIGLVVRRKAFIGVPYSLCLIQPFPPAKAIFAGFGILLAVCLSSSDLICISP